MLVVPPTLANMAIDTTLPMTLSTPVPSALTLIIQYGFGHYSGTYIALPAADLHHILKLPLGMIGLLTVGKLLINLAYIRDIGHCLLGQQTLREGDVRG